MAELAMLADKQQMVYPEEVTCQLHVMAQARESLPIIDRGSDSRNSQYSVNHNPTLNRRLTWQLHETELTEESSYEECGKWNIDDWWDHVDEPVRQERSDAQEHNVVEQVLTMSLYLRR